MRTAIPKHLQIAVFHRDYWHCRYCLSPVFFNPTLNLLDQMSPGHGYFHAHGKTDRLLPLFQWYFASADHIVPVASGGENSEENLVTACWKCNLAKNDGDPSLFKVHDVPESLVQIGWDGFSSLYPKLKGAKPEWATLIAGKGAA